jgi:hypothetical protein
MRDGLTRQGKADGIELGAHRGLQVISCAGIARKQILYFLSQPRIIAANLIEQKGTLFRIALHGAMEQLFNLRPAFRSQPHLLSLHFVVKPRFRQSQIAPHGHRRYLERLSDLFHGEPAEIAELDRFAFPRIDLLECIEATVQSQ